MDVCHPSPSAPEIVVPASRSPSPIPSIISATSSHSPDVLLCLEEGCEAMFSGKYRRGNLQRHIRLKHVHDERLYACKAASCGKIFKRQDARLKHYRKQHPSLGSAPVHSRRWRGMS
jgi:hypothetical protein